MALTPALCLLLMLLMDLALRETTQQDSIREHVEPTCGGTTADLQGRTLAFDYLGVEALLF